MGTPTAPTPEDHELLMLVLRDLLSTDAGDSPVGVRGKPPGSLLVSSTSARWWLPVEDILDGLGQGAWKAVPDEARPPFQRAAEDLVERARVGFAGFASTYERIRIRQGNARDEPTVGFEQRPIDAWPPGYAPDRSLAVVCLAVPWSIHSSQATYVLVREPEGWKISSRRFVYFP